MAVYESVYLIRHNRLTQCAGISGGQARRLTIGVEIINLPDLIFLDEPTTGLDSNISYEVNKKPFIMYGALRQYGSPVLLPVSLFFKKRR